MSLHPFLSVPENERVYQLLSDCPAGTTRSWATKAGWTQAKLVRFLKRLSELGLAEVHPFGKQGSVFKPIDRVDANRSESMRVDASRSESMHLGSKASRSTASRYAEPRTDDRTATASTEEREAIRTVNDVLGYRFGDQYTMISEDNIGSLAAVRQIAGAGIPLEEARLLLRSQAMTFTPDKTGGDLPRSLGHPWFAKAVIREWRIRRREATETARLEQLELMPQVQLTVQRGAIEPTKTDEPINRASTTACAEGLALFRAAASGDLKLERVR